MCWLCVYQSKNITYNIIVCWMSQNGMVNAVKRSNRVFLRLECFEQQMNFFTIHKSTLWTEVNVFCVLYSCYELRIKFILDARIVYILSLGVHSHVRAIQSTKDNFHVNWQYNWNSIYSYSKPIRFLFSTQCEWNVCVRYVCRII